MAPSRGEIGSTGDRDWFAVTLEAGRTHQFDLTGQATLDGALMDPYLRGLCDAGGSLIPGTAVNGGGMGGSSRLVVTTAEAASTTCRPVPFSRPRIAIRKAPTLCR